MKFLEACHSITQFSEIYNVYLRWLKERAIAVKRDNKGVQV